MVTVQTSPIGPTVSPMRKVQLVPVPVISRTMFGKQKKAIMCELFRKDTSWRQHLNRLLLSQMQFPGDLMESNTAKMRCYFFAQVQATLKFTLIVLQVFLDVIESVNLLAGASGNVLLSEIVGAIKMRVYLSGMPELRLGLNDKVLFESTGRGKSKSVELEDVKFHQCVRLSRFSQTPNAVKVFYRCILMAHMYLININFDLFNSKFAGLKMTEQYPSSHLTASLS